MNCLAISLGHNSSAILIHDGIFYGYEEERFTKIKSDSHYPENAINALHEDYDLTDVENIYISHWFTDGRLPTVPNKYFNVYHLYDTCPNATLHSVGSGFTHHDAHIYSAMLFAGSNYVKRPGKTIGIVADGFGNFGETLSIYEISNGIPNLIKRHYGFDTSLGLIYQYATAFLGMKENQDEYKLLGYEPEMMTTFSESIKIKVRDEARKWVDKLLSRVAIRKTFDPVISVSALPALRDFYRAKFQVFIESCGESDPESVGAKILVANLVQQVIEICILRLIDSYEPDNILLSGGVFMNVKLNMNILYHNNNLNVCIMPLCGDQGAALGLAYKHNPELTWPEHLYWGPRQLRYGQFDNADSHLKYFHGEDYSEAIEYISNLLHEDKIVNVVQGNMEFGARALCNTSTLALPTRTNVAYINHCNQRSTIMPMAPVTTEDVVNDIFGEDIVSRVHKSLEYMVCALKAPKSIVADYYLGVFHNLDEKHVSSRVQIARYSFIIHILNKLYDMSKFLINTSFNIHGVPIVYDAKDVLKSHEFQRKYDYDDKIFTVVIGE